MPLHSDSESDDGDASGAGGEDDKSDGGADVEGGGAEDSDWFSAVYVQWAKYFYLYIHFVPFINASHHPLCRRSGLNPSSPLSGIFL